MKNYMKTNKNKQRELMILNSLLLHKLQVTEENNCTLTPYFFINDNCIKSIRFICYAECSIEIDIIYNDNVKIEEKEEIQKEVERYFEHFVDSICLIHLLEEMNVDQISIDLHLATKEQKPLIVFTRSNYVLRCCNSYCNDEIWNIINEDNQFTSQTYLYYPDNEEIHFVCENCLKHIREKTSNI